MSVDRIELEQVAMESVTAEFYYDLADTVQETPDEELKDIIEGRVPASIHFKEGMDNVRDAR